MLRIVLCVFLGSGLGGALRYAVSVWTGRFIARHAETESVAAVFPWATLGVNIAGCFIIGFVYGLVDAGVVNMSPESKAMLTTGFCGGLTTFSTFSNENYLLFQSHGIGIALLYASVSLILGAIVAWGGQQSAHCFAA